MVNVATPIRLPKGAQLLTVKEAAERLRKSVGALRIDIYRNPDRYEIHRIGHSIRVVLDDYSTDQKEA